MMVGCYLPPNMGKQRGEAALDYLEDSVLELKRRYKDLLIVVAGDFNQRDVAAALADFPDLKETATRGSKKLIVSLQK